MTISFDITKLMPIIMIIESIIAAGVYGANGDFRHMIYWFAGAVITATVTF